MKRKGPQVFLRFFSKAARYIMCTYVQSPPNSISICLDSVIHRSLLFLYYALLHYCFLVLLVNRYFLVTPLCMHGFSNRKILLFSILYAHPLVVFHIFLVARDFFTYTLFTSDGFNKMRSHYSVLFF